MSETINAPAGTSPVGTGGAGAKRRRATFHRLRVSEIRSLTTDSIEVTFHVPEELADDYDYAPGQYVALRGRIDGQEIRRSYSICAEPVRGEIKVAIKKTLGGVFSTWANEELKVGDELEVMNPQGAFTSSHSVNITSMNDAEQLAAREVAKNAHVHLVAFAAGSGITPIMAITRAVLAASANSSVDLVYANRSSSDVMFAEELGDMKDRYPSRFAIHHVLSREQRINPLLSGRIDAEKLTELLDHVIQVDRTDEWFLCGPFELVQMCRDTLAERGVPEEAIRFELFTTGNPQDPQGQTGRVVHVDPSGENVEITFTLDGLTGQVESPVAAHETVLNAALRSRPDVPFACAGGVCGTCRAKVVDGEYEMAENFALEPDEVAAGYVLTCQTRPTGKTLSVDFDS
ncbi:phenylacetate-CoA oxygenase/reductase subunit PaaK [Kocuria coralli]|uniref:Phenylacetate-CoA oxygenase/reductase subunit PaaK n=1 Tax=Kocuria coralli TaxID=1461025 RepID=A0A5J5KXB7_9MICC|nr:1,2-phenylacetyl-CoA epoxidase subunit PaaE [Kocuria coralli]KAA9394323.1 phenylacetate-CoA oxygenase/reductase subunit PaaK [Kocuria coralli]